MQTIRIATLRLLSLVLFALAPAAWAGPQVGTITLVSGEVKLFTHPSKDTAEGPPPHAKFEGMYYSVQDVKAGDRVEKGNIVRTQPGARARVIYDNGDQIYVAPATSYKIDWDKDADDGQPTVDLRYGKARFMVSKGGPRSRFLIRTKSAVLGVRGTDFFVAVNDNTGVTETATLRGSVEVKSGAEGAQSALVKTGETGSVAPPAPQAPEAPPTQVEPPKVEVRPTSQQELKAVQRNSVIKDAQAPPQEAVQTVKNLETTAEKATLNDIRAADPTLADKIEAAPPTQEPRLDAINQATVDQIAKSAPKVVAAAAPGPISDEKLEKSQVAQSVEKATPPAAEEKPEFPVAWIGIKGGHTDAGLGGNDQNFGIHDPLSGGYVGIAGELELGRNLGLVAELYPGSGHGQKIYLPCSGNCGQGPEVDFKLSAIDLALGVRPTIPFGTYRTFQIHGFLGLRLVKFTRQEQQGYTANSDISNYVKSTTGAAEVGFGVSLRLFQRLRMMAEARFNQGFGDVSYSNFPINNNSVSPPQTYQYHLGPLQDVYVGLGLQYGLF
jgi:hypothetical protein